MDLPVFQENLRSSAGWLADLEKTSKDWKQAPDDVKRRAKALQIQHARKRSETLGQQQDQPLQSAADLVSGWAIDTTALLDLERLIELHRTLTGCDPGASAFRLAEAPKLNQYHDPAPAIILPRLIENALDWFQTPSFGEIHPVEQAAIVHLRLLDLQAFDSMNEEIAALVASFYIERSGLPPLVFYTDAETLIRYEAAREAAFRMLTQHLVEFIAESVTRTMRTTLA